METEQKPKENPLPGDNNIGPKRSKPRFSIYWVYILIFVSIMALQFFNYGDSPKEINWKTFRQEMLLKGDVEKVVVVNKKNVEIYIKKDRLSDEYYKKQFDGNDMSSSSYKGPHFEFSIGSVETFEKNMAEAQADISENEHTPVFYNDRKDFWTDAII